MNAQDIWAGNDYAYSEYRRRGKSYVSGATRIRVIKTFKQRDFHASERARTMVECYIIDSKTGQPQTTYTGDKYRREVRARDVLMRWDEYEEETARRNRERDRINREAEEAEAKEAALKAELIDKLESKCGMPREAVSSVTPVVVYLNRTILEEWLGVGKKVVLPALALVEPVGDSKDVDEHAPDDEEEQYV